VREGRGQLREASEYRKRGEMAMRGGRQETQTGGGEGGWRRREGGGVRERTSRESGGGARVFRVFPFSILSPTSECTLKHRLGKTLLSLRDPAS